MCYRHPFASLVPQVLQRLQDGERFGDVFVDAELRAEDVADDAGLVDDEGLAAVDEAERALDAVLLAHLAARVGDELHGQLVARGEGGVILERVAADADELGAGGDELFVGVAEGAGFARAAGRRVARVEEEHHVLVAAERRQRHLAAAPRRQREIGRAISDGDGHDSTTTSCTSTLPRVALEYGHTLCAASSSACASAGATPGRRPCSATASLKRPLSSLPSVTCAVIDASSMARFCMRATSRSALSKQAA